MVYTITNLKFYESNIMFVFHEKQDCKENTIFGRIDRKIIFNQYIPLFQVSQRNNVIFNY